MGSTLVPTKKDKIEHILRDTKKFTSIQLGSTIRENPEESRKEWILWMMERAGRKNNNNMDFQFWQQDNHPIEIFSNSVFQQKINYIHENPAVNGFVDSPEAYLYSSARDHSGQKDLLKGIILI